MFFSLALALPLVSAINFDNTKNSINIPIGQTFDVGGKALKYNSIWGIYSPIEIRNWLGLGKTLFRGALTKHTDVCGQECSSTMQIYLAEDSVLIDDVIFKTLQYDGSWVEQDVRGYQFYVSSLSDDSANAVNGISYSIGDEVKAGNYEVRLDAEKKPSRTVDWVIETQGETLNSWATWGNISGGDDAEVLLNSPANNYISDTYEVTFNCSANVTGGATLVNISLWTNETGSWAERNTNYAEDGTTHDPDVVTNPNNAFDRNSTTYADKSTLTTVELGKTFTERNVSQVVIKASGNVRASTTGSAPWSYSIKLETYNGATWTVFSTLASGSGTYDGAQGDEITTFSYAGTININLVIQGTRIAITSTTGGGGGETYKRFYLIEYGDFLETATTHTQIEVRTNLYPIDWTCQACDSDGDCGFALENRTLLLDTEPPVINITYPTTSLDYGYTGENTTLNWTVIDTNLESCWYNYNNTNTTVTCNDNNASFIIEKGNHTIIFYANDSVANINNTNRTWVYKIFNNLESYNSTTYETAPEGFRINITSDGTQTVLANLMYHGTLYTGTKVGNNVEMEFYKDFANLPEILGSTAENKSFYWNITYGSEVMITDTINQSVGRIALGLCNSTLTTPYINFTFKDEETTIATNATIDSSTWYYYLGNGVINKTLLYSTTASNESYGFCFIPIDRTMKNSIVIQYSDTGYPQRRWTSTTDLTNSTTNQSLYMLASADGTYSVYQVQTSTGTGISGVYVQAERQFAGVWTTVEEGATGSGGAVTFWLNPDYDHRLTFTKSGYETVQVTIRPSSSTYTVVMGTGEVVGATYNSSTEGLSWKIYPDLGKILFPNTTQLFAFNITANLSNIDSCKMEIVNNNSVSLGITTGCNSQGGNLSLSVTLGNNRSVRAIYSVDIGEGYFILDADAYWIIMETNIPERGTIVAFFKYAKNLNEFGSDDNRQEYSRVVFFFLMLSIIMGSICYSTGWDFSTGGGSMIFMTFIIIMASYSGFLTLSYTGVNGWMDQHVVALITSLFTAGFILNKFAREA